jgi:hypothetical protein
MAKVTRRSFVDTVLKGSVLSLSFSVGGVTMLLTPEEARAKAVPLKVLDATQARILEMLADVILPGSVAAGVVNFVDHQLGADPNDALLLAKYFQVALPYKNFYAAGTKIAAKMSQTVTGKAIETLDKAGLNSLVKEMAKPGAVVDGFPIFLFYMCFRSDAVDVTYGTPAGFKKLNIPYMQHIMPPEGWNG